MLYSKNGSIPQPQTDGTEGWIEVNDPPVIESDLGLEVVWWYPPGWVIRRTQPENTETTVWKWSQTEVKWVEYPKPTTEDTITSEDPVP
jgi:hypothetical protein